MGERLGTKRPREVIKALEILGGEVIELRGKVMGKGSHTAVRMPGVARPVVVQDAEYSREMLRNIARQAQVKWEDFVRAFDQI